MLELDERMVAVWQCAAAELGFRLVAPFETRGVNGKPLLLEGYLPDFGGQQGIMLVSHARRIKFSAVDRPMSILSTRKYVRKYIIAALKDWGWSGPGEPPEWLK